MKKTNILLAIADDLAWPHLSAYGCSFINTPHIDRVAREGALFHQCYTTAPTCTASRGSLLTGLYPWQLEEGCQLWGLLPKKYETYPDILEKEGYFVGVTNKGWGPGSIEASGRTRNPAGPSFDEHQCEPLTDCMSKNDYAANFSSFLDQKGEDQPFCFWYGAKEPHRSFEKGSGLKFGKKLEDVEVPGYLPDCDEVRSDFLDYALEVERYDDDLGKMIKILEERGELENTIIMVTGDNGFPFPRAKATVYQNGCHVPLAIRWGKECPSARSVTDFVSFVDIAPTLLDIVGIDPQKYDMTGRSFLDVIRSPQSGRVDPSRDHVFTGRERHSYCRPNNIGNPMRSIVTDDFLYIHNFEPENGVKDVDGSPTKSLLIDQKDDPAIKPYYDLVWGERPHDELYTAVDGPDCISNRAKEESYESTTSDLKTKLFAALKEHGDPRMHGRGWVLDSYPYYGTSGGAEPDFPTYTVGAYHRRHLPDGETVDVNAIPKFDIWED